MGSETEIHLLSIGLEDAALPIIASVLSRTKVTSEKYDVEKLMEVLDPPPQIILCGPPPADVSLIEIAQMLRMQYSHAPIYFISFMRQGYDRKIFVKNGFTDAFILTMDKDILLKALNDDLAKISNGKIKSYRSVKILDIQPGVVLNFDTSVYLPLNNKYVKYGAAGSAIDENRVKKLKSHKLGTVYVETNQMKEFYTYTATQLKSITKSGKLSETEKKEKLENSVRELMSGVFNSSDKEGSFEQGQELLKDCHSIVNTFILESPKGQLYQKMMDTMSEMNASYSHATSVSTYAALFSLGLQMGDPEDLAIAGMFHDIGLVDIPPNIVEKKEEDRSPEEQKAYEKHPEISLSILKNRKVALSDKIQKAILQHHERWSGAGYPNGYEGVRISKEAQVVALADQFDYLTRVSEGKAVMSPQKAILELKKQDALNPKKAKFDPNLLEAVSKLFPREA